MEAFLVILVLLLLLGRHLPQISRYLRKGSAEFIEGLRWYREALDEATARRLVRGLAWALGIAVLCVVAILWPGWIR
jgi:hypothetical protein